MQTVKRLGPLIAPSRDREALERKVAGLEVEARWLRAALDCVRDAVISADASGNVVQMNRAAETLTGYREVEGKAQAMGAVFKLAEDETGSKLDRIVRQVLQDGVALELAPESRLRARDDTERSIVGRCAALRDEQRQVSGAVLLFREPAPNGAAIEETLDHQRARRDLEASEKRYRRLFEGAKDGILILDSESGKIVDVNPFLIELTGYTYEEFLGKHLWEIGPFKDVAASRASFEQLLAQQYVRYDDLPLEARNGRKIDVEFVSNIYRVGSENVIQCNIRDITVRKAADAERMRLMTAIEQAAETVVVTDAQGSIAYVNPAFETVTGYSRAEVIGHNARILKSGAHNDAFYRTLWATIREGKIWRGRMISKRRDGTRYTEEMSIAPVRDGAGAITHYVAVKRDITRDLSLEAQLLQAQKMEAVGRLAGGVAHDFNNLLTVILGLAELMQRDLAEGDPMREDLEEVKKAGQSATALTRQLLLFSRRQVADPRVVDVNELLAGMDKMVRRIIGEDIELVSVPAPNVSGVLVDPNHFEQVILNLVVNARDAMPTGGKLTLQTANVDLDGAYAEAHLGVRAGPHVMVAVSDTGCGMDAATQARIFEPFFTTKEVGRGSGLGLSTVFGIVKQAQGSIGVYSELGRGTTFKVYLPRTSRDAGVPVDAPSPPLPRGVETILLVEDEEQVRRVTRTVLTRHGYRVLEAANAGEALLLSETHPGRIDLLLSDVVMPKMSGPEVAKRIVRARPETRVLCMSGYTDEAVFRHGILEAGVSFIQKPMTPESLLRRVREVLAV
jgi:two-component system, cell cycle sensor histidine kinase and response regulator CckA